MGLGGEVFQEQGIHRSFKADMKLGDFPFGQGDDLHAGKAQMLKQRRRQPDRERRDQGPRRGQCRTYHVGRPATAIGRPAAE